MMQFTRSQKDRFSLLDALAASALSRSRAARVDRLGPKKFSLRRERDVELSGEGRHLMRLDIAYAKLRQPVRV